MNLTTNLITPKWDSRFIQLAHFISAWSKDPSRKCGAVLVRPDRTIAATGYNGFPRGCSDDDILYHDRAKKLSRVIHAEVNAILTCAERPTGYILYVWGPGLCPSCDRCAAQIIQSGITHVKCLESHKPSESDPWQSSISSALDMYREARVDISYLDG